MPHPNFRKLHRDQRYAVRFATRKDGLEIFPLPSGRGQMSAVVVAVESAVYENPNPSVLVIASSANQAARWVRRWQQWGLLDADTLRSPLAMETPSGATVIVVDPQELVDVAASFVFTRPWDLVIHEKLPEGEKPDADYLDCIRNIKWGVEDGAVARFWSLFEKPLGMQGAAAAIKETYGAQGVDLGDGLTATVL